MHRRSLFDRLGAYDTSYRIVADYEFLLRARDRLNAAYMHTTTVRMRAGGLSDGNAAIEETRRAKATSGGRSLLLAALEMRTAKVRYSLRLLRRALGRIAA